MIKGYPKSLMTKDGTRVLLRPLSSGDEGRLVDFYSRIPANERWLMRDNVADPAVIHRWIEHLDYNRVLPMVALREEDEAIIATLSLHRRPYGCLQHVGALRIMVDPHYRSRRLGTWMLLDMMRLALEIGVERLVAEFVEDLEKAAINAANKLDFFKEALLRDHVKDQNGAYHNLIIMIKNLHREWSDF